MGQGHRLRPPVEPTSRSLDDADGRASGDFETPPRQKIAVATWLAIYPTITLVLPGLEAVGVNELALPLRTLAISAVVVPAVVFVVTPALTKLLGPWLHGSSSREPGSRKPGDRAATTAGSNGSARSMIDESTMSRN